MPSIRGKLHNRRAIIDVGLQPSTVLLDPVSPVATPPIVGIQSFRGLIDTGASITCVTPAAVSKIGLRPRGRKRLGNVHNIEMHTAYSFVLSAWYEDNGTRGYYTFDPVLGCEIKDNDDFAVLIGMDIITQGNFSTTRDGEFVWELP